MLQFSLGKFFRKLPLFKGKERLSRIIFRNAINNKEEIYVHGKYGCKYYLPNIKENVGFEIFINGGYEMSIQELLIKMLPHNGTFLDLGANIGSILIPICKRRPDLYAVAVEAAPWIFNYLEKNVKLNSLKNVQLINKALYNQDDLDLDFFSPTEKFGKGSLAPVFTKSGVKVKTIMVDTIIKNLEISKVDLIKIDVEGFEYFVFRGAEKLLNNVNAPVILFEFVDWAESKANGLKPGAAQQLLMDKGYQLYKIDGGELKKVSYVITEGSFNMVASKKSLVLT